MNEDKRVKRYYKVRINETARDSLREEPYRAGKDEETFGSIEMVREEMIRRYGKVPGGRNKVYRDTADGAQEVGFLHTFWNVDGMYQTDWVEIAYVEERMVLIKELRQ